MNANISQLCPSKDGRHLAYIYFVCVESKYDENRLFMRERYCKLYIRLAVLNSIKIQSLSKDIFKSGMVAVAT